MSKKTNEIIDGVVGGLLALKDELNKGKKKKKKVIVKKKKKVVVKKKKKVVVKKKKKKVQKLDKKLKKKKIKEIAIEGSINKDKPYIRTVKYKTKKRGLFNRKFIRVVNNENVLKSVVGLTLNDDLKLRKFENFSLGFGDVGWIEYELWKGNRFSFRISKKIKANKIKNDIAQKPTQQYGDYLKMNDKNKHGLENINGHFKLNPGVMAPDIQSLIEKSEDWENA